LIKGQFQVRRRPPLVWIGRNEGGKPAIGWPTWVVIGLLTLANLMILTALIQAPLNDVSLWYVPLRCLLLVGTTRCIVMLYFWLPAYKPTARPDEA
jgi:hypothetical protein